MSSRSDAQEVRRALIKQGFTATKTGGGHWRITHPRMSGPVFTSDTPGDRRSRHNLLALLRRRMRPH